MGTNTAANVGQNSVLLFGDFGTEVIRLSQLYDPKNDEYQKVTTGTRPSSSKTYYLPSVRDRALLFETVDFNSITPYLDSEGRFTDEHPFWVLVETNEGKQHGKYVPVPQTLVVVDPTGESDASDDSASLVKKWGTYTLLVVDKVYDGTIENDPTYARLYAKYQAEEITEEELNRYIPSYESVLTPINFTAGVDSATRAVDYNNSQLMLYVNEIELPTETGSTVKNVAYRLVPDRKLMMYGQKTLRYLIKKTLGGVETIICTNSTIAGHSDAQEFVDYVSAAGSFQGATTQITTEAEYRELAGKTVQYFDVYGVKQTGLIRTELSKASEAMNADDTALMNALIAVYARGDTPVVVLNDTGDALSNIQLPSASYLRKNCASLKNGETVTFEVYEYGVTEEGQQRYHRLVSSSKLVVKLTAAVDTGDLTQAQITGFNVIIRQNGIDNESDLWELPAKSSGQSLDDYLTNLNMRAILKLDDGSTEVVNTAANKGKCYFEFNLDRIESESVFGEFDVLFKYFPNRKFGHQPTDALDARYIKCVINQSSKKILETATVPDSSKKYYIKEVVTPYNEELATLPDYVKVDDGSSVYMIHYSLAGGSGHPTTFITGKEYYYEVTDASGNVKLTELPSPLKQYFVKNEDGALELAPNNGAPSYFIKNKEYYYVKETIAWDSAVNRPARDFILCKKRIKVVNSDSTTLRYISVIPYWKAETSQWELKFLAFTNSMNSPALIGLEDSADGRVEIVEGLPDFNTPIANGETNRTVYNLTLRYYPSGSSVPLSEVVHVAVMLQHWTSVTAGAERWLIKYDNIGYGNSFGSAGGGYRNATDLMNPEPTGNLPAYGRQDPATNSYRPYLICDKDDIGNVVIRVPGSFLVRQAGYSELEGNVDLNDSLFTQMFYQRAELREVSTVASMVPTHFRLRSIENKDLSTPWVKLTADAVAAPIDATNLPQPKKVVWSSGSSTYEVVNMSIVIMEFASYVGGVYSALQAVPVEVRLDE